MRRVYPGISAARTVLLTIPKASVAASAPAAMAVRASTPATTTTTSNGFWDNASTGEKIAIAGGVGLVGFFLYLAFKK